MAVRMHRWALTAIGSAVTTPAYRPRGRTMPMQIVSWNVNGIRAILKKNFLEWLERERPDIVGLQETKARLEQVPAEHVEAIQKLGYHIAWNAADRGGYSGVATLSRKPPLFVTEGVPFENSEGRVLATEHGDFTFYNIYFPNGRQREDGPDPERLRFKLEFYDNLLALLEEERAEGKNVVVSGDYNVAHTEIDIARPKENQTVTGFLPEERKALQRYIDAGFVDVFRHFHPARLYEGREPSERIYTWWTYRGGARARNIGWRIDYHFVNQDLLPCVKGADVCDEVHGSDHCPISVDLDI
ncbi:MAG: exodeoxyribonuclease-3 [Hyphomicrobiaceae bacterium]